MDDSTSEVKPEPMEESADTPAEPRSSEKIDLSLDDIIKLNRKEKRANNSANKVSEKAANKVSDKAVNKARNRRARNKKAVLKKLEKAGQQQKFTGRPEQYKKQGPNRLRFVGPPTNGFYRLKTYNLKKTRFGTKGVSPLNRPNTKDPIQSGRRKPFIKGVFYQPNRAPNVTPRRPTPQFKGQPPSFQPKQRHGDVRPFILNRGFTTPKNNEKLSKYQRVRSWKKVSSSGSTLTVSLPNSLGNSDSVHTATVKERSTDAGGRMASLQPKGIPFKFNLKATINQTGVTLNDRFTGLRIQPGQRSRGRGQGRGRGMGRTVTLQQ
ncbi:UAP56-interacting factor [Aplochiton taeniatus]